MMLGAVPGECSLGSAAAFSGYMAVMASGLLAVRLAWSWRHRTDVREKKQETERETLLNEEEEAGGCEDSVDLAVQGADGVKAEAMGSSEKQESAEASKTCQIQERRDRNTHYYNKPISLVFNAFALLESCSLWIVGVSPSTGDAANENVVQVVFISLAFLSELVCDTITGVADYKMQNVRMATSMARFVIILLELCVAIIATGCAMGSSQDGVSVMSIIGVFVCASYWGTYMSPVLQD